MDEIFWSECKELRSQLTELWQDQKFCDLTLKTIDGKEFHVHKIVLCSLSEYFKRMLNSNDWIESKSNMIQLDENLPSDQLQFVLEFVYTGVIEPTKLSCEKGIDILKTGFCLSMSALKDYISLYLKEQISKLNCLSLWRASVSKQDNNLESEAIRYINENFIDFFNDQVLNLKESEILQILSLPNSEPNQEVCYLNSIKWIKADLENRQNISENILKKIQFSLLTNDFKIKYVLSEKNLYQNEYFISIMMKDFSTKLEMENCRYTFVNPYLITSGDLNQLDVKNQKIIKLFNAKRAKGFSVTKSKENRLFISGGENTNKFEYIFNNESFLLPPMKESRWYHSSLYYRDKIYCCGGEKKNTMEIFDVQAMKWFNGPTMLKSSSRFCMIGKSGVLYANGMKLDLRLNKWDNHIEYIQSCTNCRNSYGGNYNCVFYNKSFTKLKSLKYKKLAWTVSGCGIVDATSFNTSNCVKYPVSSINTNVPFTNVESFEFGNDIYFFGGKTSNKFYLMKYNEEPRQIQMVTPIAWNNVETNDFYIC